jgi:hypothetical protein
MHTAATAVALSLLSVTSHRFESELVERHGNFLASFSESFQAFDTFTYNRDIPSSLLHQ